MFTTDDTIVAIATPPGRSGVGIVRLSGPEAARIAGELVGRESPFEPRHATFGKLTSIPSHGATSVSDHVLVTVFASPHSYTGEEVAEISAHGSPVVLDGILRRAIDAGARLAEPGEFTLRAFLHGKLDLIQAEAVADLIDAVTPLQARAAFDQLEGTLTTVIASIEAELFDLMARLEASLDFPEEGYHFVEPGSAGDGIDRVIGRVSELLASASRGRMVREGAAVAIVGAPNVGKSSLFNALLNANRAIVTAIAGTTRDLVTERADIRGLSIALVDTAGIRETDDVIEQEGVARARGAAEVADLLLLVLDRSRPLNEEDEALLAATRTRRRIVVWNKIDLPAAARKSESTEDVNGGEEVEVSVITGAGVSALAARIAEALGSAGDDRDPPRVTNIRHIALLERAGEALARARDAVRASNGAIPEEFVLADLQDAATQLQEVSGKRSSDDLLRHIFERFCIGK